MRYLKKYNESSEEQDLDFVLAKIKEKFPISVIDDMYSTETEAWSDNYENEGNGEAEDVLLNQMIGWFQKEHSKSLSEEMFEEVYNKLQDIYKVLKH